MMQVIIEDQSCIGGETDVELEDAIVRSFCPPGVPVKERFAQLVVILHEKGVLTLEDCGQLCGQPYIRKAGVQ